ncbi:glycosyltransferase [Allorhodopirellula solitaria]|uniref:Alpha-1,4-N-acetyl-D-galactosaminyltransferase n=1 Tax=Allorhodopirellula solitaria TaxID=2527987 RepID=A0A5C5X2Y7_9BACT|nr:glycosyltransferase [Allorhodopirellula solitaria]TWT56631.1 alpha-1,4-N-acetyl-D-galactosaminyltransferase [Allorhodopirellula solitaria]
MIHSLDGGGAERVMAGLAGRLAKRNHRVDLITLDDGSRSRHHLDGAVHRIPLDVMSTPDRKVGWIRRVRRLRAAIGQGGYDVVLSFCDSTNLLVLLATRGLRPLPRVVVSERSDPAHQSMGRLREWLRDRAYPQADAVVCLSDDVAATLNRRMKVHTVVIPSAIQTPPPGYEHVGSTENEASPVSLIAIGRLEREKGFDRLLQALAEATQAKTVPSWRLKILGDGSQLSELQRQARELGIEERVEFCGWVGSVWPHLAQSDVFVLPSRYEGFPSALLEAMTGGLAVLAVDAGGGVRSAIQHEANGWLVENTTPALTEGLATLLPDVKLQVKLSTAAPEISNQFHWSTMVDAYEQVLRG